MNIITPIPNSFSLPTNPVGTDSVRRDNLLREAIPSITQGERSAAQKSLGNDSERSNQAANQGNLFQNPTYDRPSVNQAFANDSNADANKDNANEQSAGKEGAESKQEQQQEQIDDKNTKELKDRDREVRAHEQAHAAAGGQYAGAPSYEYETGPDGKRYAIGGEVSIDVSTEKTPTETIQKMRQVQAAALAPAEPSAQDYKVASEATQKEQTARSELAKEQSVGAKSGEQAVPDALEKTSKLSESAQLAATVVNRFYAEISSQAESNLSSIA
ncbi:MAG: hypothetical protein ACI97K_002753 [Glaciecola sp.]|jgi:hypothetical protein